MKIKTLVLSSIVAVMAFAPFAASTAMAQDHHHGHKVCHWSKHMHKKVCRWVR